MKKIGILIALALCLTISGVYATWVYSNSDDVTDITAAKAITMTDATFEGTYGTYHINADSLIMKIDPKAGTTHTTSLQVTGEIIITFTPATYAPADVKTGGVPTTYQFGLSNDTWTYDSQSIMSVDTVKKDVVWTSAGDGTLTCTINAATIANALTLTEFVLDTKAEYDAYDRALTNGQITLAVSDGKNASTIISQ